MAAPITRSQRRALLCAIPEDDAREFARLPDRVRQRVLVLLGVIDQCRRAPRLMDELRRQAALLRGRRGYSLSRLRNLYYQYARSGDWRVLIDRARAPERERVTTLPEAFLEWWRELCERNQRKCRPAHAELLHIWRTQYDTRGRHYTSIPGYGSWPEPDPMTDIPTGWTYGNLMRYQPTALERAAARLGRAAVADHRPQVHTTRAGLVPGQRIFLDDQEYDVVVNYIGVVRRAIRPLGLDALDHASGCYIAHGFKPTTDRADGTRCKLSEQDTLWLVTYILTDIGYRADVGTTFVVERGTATIRPPSEERIARVTAGRVRVERSGLDARHPLLGQYASSPRGNFRYKAPLESLYNLVRNRMAALPGATGKDRAHSPTQLHGMERYNAALMRAYETLPERYRGMLQFPMLGWHEFVDLALRIYDAIDRRTDHALEGWQASGHVINEFRLDPAQPDGWQRMEALQRMTPDQRAAVEAYIRSTPGCLRTRRLSPREVWSAHRGSLTRVADCLVPELLGPGAAREVRVDRHGYIIIRDHDIAPDELRYLAASGRDLMPRGERYNAYLNPFSPRRLHLTDARGRYVATCELWDRPTADDAEAIRHRLGRVRAIEAAELAPVQRRAAAQAREQERIRRRNLDVLRAAQAGPAALGDPEQRRRAREDMQRICDTAARTAQDEQDDIDRAERQLTAGHAFLSALAGDDHEREETTDHDHDTITSS